MRSMTLAQMGDTLQLPFTLPPFSIQGYAVDSRSLREGELFFALKGERTDGHEHLDEVRAKGAVAAVVSKEYRGEAGGLCLVRVEEPLHILQELARSVLARHSGRIVGITGSLGKTSTKEFTKALLSKKYRVAASPGNSNSQIGLPLAILQHTTGDEEVLVLEMGMTAPGQLTRLVQIAPPEVAVITTVALVHACYFQSLEEIAWAKAEILSHPHTCLGIVHRDVAHFDEVCRVGQCRKLSFSTENREADYKVDVVGSTFRVQAHLEKHSYDLGVLPVPGGHNRHNALAAVAVARHFNVGWGEIKEALPSLVLPERRLQFVPLQGILFVNDAYNAAELSVKAAFQTMPRPERAGRKIAVFGSMLELGKFSEESHKRVGEFALDYVDRLYCLGEECLSTCRVWEEAGRPSLLFKDRMALVAALKMDLRPDDVVLLKGSRAKELWKVLEEF